MTTALLAECAKKKKIIKLLVKHLFPPRMVSQTDPMAHQHRFPDPERGGEASTALPSSYQVSHAAFKLPVPQCHAQQAATGRIKDLPKNRWTKGEKRVTGLLTPRPLMTLWRIPPSLKRNVFLSSVISNITFAIHYIFNSIWGLKNLFLLGVFNLFFKCPSDFSLTE